MLLIPTIALHDGACAGSGITPGDAAAPDEALRVAAAWIAAGVHRLHVEDRDAGAPGKRLGLHVIRALSEAYPDVPIQVAGDFRDSDAVALYLGAGAEYMVLESKAAAAGHFVNDLCLEYPGHVLLTMEAKTAMASRSKLARHPLEEAARRVQQEGVTGIVYRASADASGFADVSPALELAAALAIPVQVSAGIASPEALRQVCARADGLAGAILDTAYHSELLDFAVAAQLADRAQAAE